MARKGALPRSNNTYGLVRTVTGTIAVDNASLIDANYPTSQAVDSLGFDTVFFTVEIDGGASPSVTIELLERDDDAADGSRWKRFACGPLTGVVAPGTAPALQDTGAIVNGGNAVELVTYGRVVFPRIKAVANATGTTAVRILARPGTVRPKKTLAGD